MQHDPVVRCASHERGGEVDLLVDQLPADGIVLRKQPPAYGVPLAVVVGGDELVGGEGGVARQVDDQDATAAAAAAKVHVNPLGALSTGARVTTAARRKVVPVVLLDGGRARAGWLVVAARGSACLRCETWRGGGSSRTGRRAPHAHHAHTHQSARPSKRAHGWATGVAACAADSAGSVTALRSPDPCPRPRWAGERRSQ